MNQSIGLLNTRKIKGERPVEPLFHAIIPIKAHCVKKNTKQIRFNRATKKPFICSNDKSKRLENELALRLAQFKKHNSINFPITGPITLKLIFYYKKNKNGQSTKKIADLSNLLQGPEDALQKAGIILDDKQIESFDGTRRITDHDKNVLEISIFPFEE